MSPCTQGHRRSQTKGPASCGASSIRENRAAVLPAPRQNGGVRGRRRINAEGFRWLEPPYTREEQRLLWKPPHIRLTSRLMVSLLLRIERESQGRVRVCRNVDDIQEAMEEACWHLGEDSPLRGHQFKGRRQRGAAANVLRRCFAIRANRPISRRDKNSEQPSSEIEPLDLPQRAAHPWGSVDTPHGSRVLPPHPPPLISWRQKLTPHGTPLGELKFHPTMLTIPVVAEVSAVLATRRTSALAVDTGETLAVSARQRCLPFHPLPRWHGAGRRRPLLGDQRHRG
jgi:hypothetical protein